jgi:hypothetical protein
MFLFHCFLCQVDKGFVAQVADVIGGREAPLSAEQKEEGEKTVPGEFTKVKHVRGILSMGRYATLLHILQVAQCVQFFYMPLNAYPDL